MTLQDYAQFANANPVCYLATADGNQPRVRAFFMWFADETGFYFHTGSTKAVCRQIEANANVEACFFTPEPAPGKMMRVAGRVEFDDDDALKARLLDERTFLKDIEASRPDVVRIFRIATGEARFWTMADNLREAGVERTTF